jgi:exodeoxyribonuclease-5
LKPQFEYVLREYLGFAPTDDQEKAINALARFVYSPNSKVGFILKGYAGTGKTSLIGSLVKTLDKFGMRSVLLAPTGRAAKVLSNFSQKDALTIHKKIYFQNKKEGQMQFTLGKNTHKNTIFIVDEASMIAAESFIDKDGVESRDLLEDLLRYVYFGDNCRLIFIGDGAQLPPVGSAQSPALDKNYLEQGYDIPFGVVELKQVVRQRDESGILYNATHMRVQMLTDMGKKQATIQLFPNGRDVQAITGETLQDDLDYAISNFGIENTLVICRSNKRANLFNQQIRHRILYNDSQINAGDLIMVVKNNYHWIPPKTDINDKGMTFIANGDIAEIMRINRTEELYGFTFADVTIRFIDYPTEPELECKIILDAIMAESASLPMERMNQLFKSIELDYMDEPNRGKRVQKIMKSPHYQALQVKFAYSVTCHKSQGGQWPVVFIDQGYLTDEMVNLEYQRWLYTALTRATERVYLVNFNEQFIGSE